MRHLQEELRVVRQGQEETTEWLSLQAHRDSFTFKKKGNECQYKANVQVADRLAVVSSCLDRMEVGSGKSHLQVEALKTVLDQFAASYNKVERFNSSYACPGTEAVDTFTVNWSGENNWWCPPPTLVRRMIRHAKCCKAQGTLVVPCWESAPFWPLLCPKSEEWASFVVDYRMLPLSEGLIKPSLLAVVDHGVSTIVVSLLAVVDHGVSTIVGNLQRTRSARKPKPVKLGGLSSTQRLHRAQDKFQKASAILKIRLEESYQTSFEGLEEPDAKKAKEDADELSLYRHLMESLKDKFHQSKSYQEKLQIQSPFTIEETQHFPVLCMMQECKSCPGKEVRAFLAYFVSKEAVLKAEASLEERFSTSHTIKGTQRYHRYIRQPTNNLSRSQHLLWREDCCGQCHGITAD
ncbi:hypothetical protein EMCRGX_G013798 [Ephydatia muelleri]